MRVGKNSQTLARNSPQICSAAHVEKKYGKRKTTRYLPQKNKTVESMQSLFDRSEWMDELKQHKHTENYCEFRLLKMTADMLPPELVGAPTIFFKNRFVHSSVIRSVLRRYIFSIWAHIERLGFKQEVGRITATHISIGDMRWEWPRGSMVNGQRTRPIYAEFRHYHCTWDIFLLSLLNMSCVSDFRAGQKMGKKLKCKYKSFDVHLPFCAADSVWRSTPLEQCHSICRKQIQSNTEI